MPLPILALAVITRLCSCLGVLHAGMAHAVPAPVPPPVTVTTAPAPAGPAASSVLSPALNYQNIVNIGAYKAKLPAFKVFVQGIQAGAYIAFGAFLALSVGGNITGGLRP